ncbi:hypothetical protein [Actinoplanes solisilvae]|uniref:hypothetical protein n=1 Tax=Actinoplanes solisilvae TaxID=2486853 RepID=UPI000FD9FA91|nr:hypothetical protein [Actinoplanes solisilvae]
MLTLTAAVVALAVLTVFNLLICFAVIRRLRAVEESSGREQYADDLPRPGTAVTGFSAVTSDGIVLGTTDLAHDEDFVGVVSVGCPACEAFADGLSERADRLPERALLIVTAGEGDDPASMVERLRPYASVVVTADDGPELAAFGEITAFPTFMRLERGVVVASHVKADAILRTFPASRAGAVR